MAIPLSFAIVAAFAGAQQKAGKKDADPPKKGPVSAGTGQRIKTEDKKNELEAFVYELRGKIDDQYADFASAEEKEKVKAKLE